MGWTFKPAAVSCAAILGTLVCAGSAFADPSSDIDAAKKAIKTQDYATALNLIQPLANAHNPNAECLLGEMYEFGYGVPMNEPEALKWYKLSARGDGGFVVHVMQYGEVPKDEAALKKYFDEVKKNADAGDAESQHLMGTLYFKGVGVKQDFKQAFDWFQKSANQGNVNAINSLGFMYQHGAFVAQDYGKAAQLYKQAADQGDPDAQNNLGFLYNKGLGVQQNNQTAYQLFTSSSNGGNIDATSNLGWMYEKGVGVARDYNKAVHLYARAAAHGVSAAKYNLGYMYQYGLGVKRQLGKAAKLYRLAASQGYPQGENELGFVTDHQGQAPGSYKLALKYYKKEAERKADMFRLVPNFDIYD